MNWKPCCAPRAKLRKPTWCAISFLVEKPDADHAPSNLASIGRYLLTPNIFDTLRDLKAGSGGKIQLSDAINVHAQQGSVETVRWNGRRFDCGSMNGFMYTSAYEYEKRLVV